MKKFIFAIFVLGILFGVFNFVFAEDNKVGIKFFYSPTCPHCAEENKFLDKLQNKYPEIKIDRFSIYEKDNVELLRTFYEKYKVSPEYYGMVPVTFTDERYFVGFNEEIGKEIEDCILACQKDKISKGEVTIVDLEGNINLPIIGKLNIKKYSLPVLAVILGILDGFNVCSLGALVLILGLVLVFKSRIKTLIFGGIFILTTAVVYGFLIGLWYKIFSFFVIYLKAMEILIGLLAVAGGIYFLRQFIKFRKTGPVCKTGGESRIVSRFSSKIQKTLKESRNILAIIGSIILFAGVITILEFPCSAVIPVVYAGILAQNHVSFFGYFFYIAFYLVFYILDEIIVFLTAFFTMTIWLASGRIINWITLAEAIILFLLGFYYLFGLTLI